MNCPYCGEKTRVTNSRPNSRTNGVWRRRTCTACQNVTTSYEAVDLNQALRVNINGRLEPFSRDILFLSVLDSLRHRKSAVPDATALTDTIVAKVMRTNQASIVETPVLKNHCYETLKHFDRAAAVYYKAHHPTN